MKLSAHIIAYSVGAAATFLLATALPAQAARSIPITITGGHDIGRNDYGRPVSLIASALGVAPEVFRRAFSGVTPARGREPTGEEARANKAGMLKVLTPLGVTNEQLDKVADYYRFQPQNGELWPNRPAKIHAVIEDSEIVRLVVDDPGAGYSSMPVLTLPGYETEKFGAILNFGTDLAQNGSIASAGTMWYAPFAPQPYSFLWGTASVSAPIGWFWEGDRFDSDTSSLITWQAIRPSGDIAAPPAQISLRLERNTSNVDLGKYAEHRIAVFKTNDGDHKVTGDRTITAENRREIKWRSMVKGVPYQVTQTVRVRDSVRVDLRISIPESSAMDTAWMALTEKALSSLTTSICSAGKALLVATNENCPDIRRVLPFSEEENEDGSYFVFFTLRRAGLTRPHSSASTLPTRTDFREVPADSVRGGDVVWYPQYMGIYDAGPSMLTDHGRQFLARTQENWGKPRFFRPLVVKSDDR